MTSLARAGAAAAAMIAATVSPLAAADLGGFRPEQSPILRQPSPPGPIAYVAVRGGGAWTGDTEFSSANGQVTTSYATGQLIGVTVGVHLDRALGELPGLRGEIEAGLVKRDADRHVRGGASTGAPFSALETNYVFASLAYDLLPNQRFTPFVGAGAGLAEVTFDVPQGTSHHKTSVSSVDWAYHGTVGVSYQMTPRWHVEAAYRYMAIPSVTPRDAQGTRQHTDTTDHLVFGGLRAHF